MRVIGIDPGTYRMGVGLVDSGDERLSMVHSEVVSPSRTDSPPERLHQIYLRLVDVIAEWSPTDMAIEEPFAARNVRSAMAIGHAQAVAMIAGAHFGLPVRTYAPTEVKRAVTDYGASSKAQVQEMVKVLLAVESQCLESDAADALAVAICHVNAERARNLAVLE